MPQNPLTLFVDHQFTSPYAMSVAVTLLEKGSAFATERLDLDAQQHQQSGYLQQSVTARVPTLVHEGFSLSESSAISEYLEEVFAPPDHAAVYPQDVQQQRTSNTPRTPVASSAMSTAFSGRFLSK